MIQFVDAPSMAIVAGGTLGATLAHCGPKACKIALAALADLRRGTFDLAQGKAELSRHVSEIASDGLLRSQPTPIGDEEIDDATSALIRSRSLDALIEKHVAYRERRLARAQVASGVFLKAAELAPILGLAGTLLSLASLGNQGAAGIGFEGAISMAVLTTFYGLVLANFLCVPIASLIDRRAHVEEQSREELFVWLEQAIAKVEPRSVGRNPERVR